MRAFEIVEIDIAVEIGLELVDRFIEGFAEGDSEEFFLYRTVETFGKAIGFRRTHLRRAVLHLIQCQEDFKRMLQFATAEFTAVVGEDVLDRYALFFVERRADSATLNWPTVMVRNGPPC